MHSLAPEIRALQGEGAVSEAACERAVALEERRVFSLHAELLLAMYTGVAAVLAGVGLLVRANLDRIGPVAVTGGILAASALGYALGLRRRPRGLAGEYLLLLGALLLGAAVAYAEVQFHLLGDEWSLHLLLLALVHALTAYATGSRLVLAAALTAFAGWMGADPRLGELWLPRTGLLDAGARALALAALYGLARWLHVRRRGRRDLAAVYEQFAVNFAFWGALALGFAPSTRWAGAVLLVLVALWVGRSGLRHRRETFVLYAIGYSTFGLVALEAQLIDDVLLASNVGLATVVVAIMLLFRLRARLKEARE